MGAKRLLAVAAMAGAVWVLALPVQSADKAGCTDPSWAPERLPGFAIAGCEDKAWVPVPFDVTGGGKRVIEGRRSTVEYTLTDKSKDPSALAVWRNYVESLQLIGAKLVSDPKAAYKAVLTSKSPQGEFWYVYTHTGGNEFSTPTYSLMTVQVGGPPPKACTLLVYGVNFDFNKSVLRPDSDPVLNQLLALFKSDSAYTAEISGHTDNVGKPDYNRTLSGERAAAVKVWLASHKVAAGRMTTVRYGDTRPVAPNTYDEGRARNRRVELKRNECK